MNKKETLISKLKLAISALEDGTIYYNWFEQSSCNCGVVAQAMLDKNRKEIGNLLKPVLSEINEMNRNSEEKNKFDRTWKQAVGLFCPITGKSMHEVFNLLMDAGMSKADMAHLEYMDNPAILKKSGIDTKKIKREKFKVMEKVEEPIPNGFWRSLLGKPRRTKEFEKEVEKERILEFYQLPENLVLYLKAWVSILEEGSTYTSEESLEEISKEELNEKLLNAVADEDYEGAGKIRDRLAEME